MADSKEQTDIQKTSPAPLVFISHDNRDAELAEAFSQLLKTVSAGMLKCFRSSDKRGTEGIEFGDEWFKTLMQSLDRASDVVCLLTERSVDRPWILYEAGVAKGKLGIPVYGIAIGIPLSTASSGPFYQFQNSDDSLDSLTKLVIQLCGRVEGLDPDKGVVKSQVEIFRARISELLGRMSTQKQSKKGERPDEATIAKVLEEMKLIVRQLPARMEQALVENPERIRFRHVALRGNQYYILAQELIEAIARGPADPVSILIIGSVFRHEIPWLFEISSHAYRIATTSDSPNSLAEGWRLLLRAAEVATHGPFTRQLELFGRETFMALRELPMFVEHFMARSVPSETEQPKKARKGTKRPKSAS